MGKLGQVGGKASNQSDVWRMAPKMSVRFPTADCVDDWFSMAVTTFFMTLTVKSWIALLNIVCPTNPLKELAKYHSETAHSSPVLRTWFLISSSIYLTDSEASMILSCAQSFPAG